jgi:hypothetical protein
MTMMLCIALLAGCGGTATETPPEPSQATETQSPQTPAAGDSGTAAGGPCSRGARLRKATPARLQGLLFNGM